MEAGMIFERTIDFYGNVQVSGRDYAVPDPKTFQVVQLVDRNGIHLVKGTHLIKLEESSEKRHSFGE